MEAQDKPPIITVDGPGGVGKGTVSRILAARLGWHLLDSGALYRLVGLSALKRGIALDDEAAVAGLAIRLDAEFTGNSGDNTVIMLDHVDVSDEIRTEGVGNAASRVAVLPAVRQALLERQRRFRLPPGLVADGRDMGTVVFPDARLKVFLRASREERAARRYKQLKDKGIDVSLDALLREIEERDLRDSSRRVAPMRPAEGAVIIDTTHMGIDEVVDGILRAWKERVA
ncbi:MAG: (d)CMP kinase [Gammaproteobacteria bacterium]|nr:(d)CMP kinase [Gammaproteobacteria bacterium]